MRILIDNFVADSRPDLLAFQPGAISTIDVLSFDWALEFPAIVHLFEEFRPDVIVLDPFAFVMAVHLLQLLDVHAFRDTFRIIGTTTVTNIIKVKATYQGFFDVVDLSLPLEDLISQLSEISAGQSHLRNDRIWTKVSRPNKSADIRLAPTDQDDVNILELLCIGLTDKDIGETVHMSHQSVRNRISKMLARSGVANRTQMAWLYKESKRVEALLIRSSRAPGEA